MTDDDAKATPSTKATVAAARKARLEARMKTNIGRRKSQTSARAAQSEKATKS